MLFSVHKSKQKKGWHLYKYRPCWQLTWTVSSQNIFSLAEQNTRLFSIDLIFVFESWPQFSHYQNGYLGNNYLLLWGNNKDLEYKHGYHMIHVQEIMFEFKGESKKPLVCFNFEIRSLHICLFPQ